MSNYKEELEKYKQDLERKELELALLQLHRENQRDAYQTAILEELEKKGNIK